MRLSMGAKSTEFIVSLLAIVLSFIAAYKFDNWKLILGMQIIAIAYVVARSHIKKDSDRPKINNITLKG